MSYKAAAAIKERLEIDTLKEMTYTDINNMLCTQQEIIESQKLLLIEAKKRELSADKWDKMEEEYWRNHADTDFDLNLGEWIADKLEP